MNSDSSIYDIIRIARKIEDKRKHIAKAITALEWLNSHTVDSITLVVNPDDNRKESRHITVRDFSNTMDAFRKILNDKVDSLNESIEDKFNDLFKEVAGEAKKNNKE